MLALPAPPRLAAAHLVLRRPDDEDVAAIFAYASDPEVTRYVGFPTHVSPDDTAGFLSGAKAEWDASGVGAYVIEHHGQVIGSTGLHLATPYRAITGPFLD
jgi:ribosomal-protein-alanine N-acetyltransferase